MQIYALALEKGGVGKTCLAVNLAAAFSRLNLRVLVIDLDAQAHASYWLGISPTDVRPEDSVLGVLNGRALRDCVRPTDEGVDVLPAHTALASLPVQLATAPNSGLFVLQDALGQLNGPTPHYDIIICDLAPARGPVLATALAAATRYAPRSAGDHVYDQLLRESYSAQLLRTILPVRAALRDSAGLQQSIFRYNGPDANEARNLFLDLVDELINLDGAT
jgi:chromosome partitioning protein